MGSIVNPTFRLELRSCIRDAGGAGGRGTCPIVNLTFLRGSGSGYICFGVGPLYFKPLQAPFLADLRSCSAQSSPVSEKHAACGKSTLLVLRIPPPKAEESRVYSLTMSEQE